MQIKNLSKNCMEGKKTYTFKDNHIRTKNQMGFGSKKKYSSNNVLKKINTNTNHLSNKLGKNYTKQNKLELHYNLGELGKKEESENQNDEEFKILIVEDNNTILAAEFRLFSEFLKSKNMNNIFKILKFNDGIEAYYEVYKDFVSNKNKIKLIISDEQMNFMNGSELYKCIKNVIKTNIPFEIISAYLDGDFTEKMKKLGIEFNEKPMNKIMVEKLFSKYLEKVLVE